MPKTIEEKVAQQDQTYRIMFDTLIDTIWVIDATTLNFLYISPDVYSSRGFTQNELIGDSVKKILTKESFKKLNSLYEQLINDAKAGKAHSQKFELQIIKKNQDLTWIEINAKIVNEKDGKLKIVGISRDINERKQTEFEREELVQELKTVIKEKKEMAQQIKQLESLLPICSGCRRIRDNKSKNWWPFEKYIEEKAGTKFSHTICPDCSQILYPKRKKSEE